MIYRDTKPENRILVGAAAVLIVGVVALRWATGCTLTPAQGAQDIAIAGPLCDAAGGAVTLETPIGGIVAVLCRDIATAIIGAETVAADAGAPDAGTARASRVTATPGCVPTLIPGDPLRQRACPEMHGAVLRAESVVGGRRP